jgi:hypothetical protein
MYGLPIIQCGLPIDSNATALGQPMTVTSAGKQLAVLVQRGEAKMFLPVRLG